MSLLDTSLDDARRAFVVVLGKRGGDDWRGDRLRGVDNLLDTRDSERDVHARDSGEMESLKRHLRSLGRTGQISLEDESEE